MASIFDQVRNTVGNFFSQANERIIPGPGRATTFFSPIPQTDRDTNLSYRALQALSLPQRFVEKPPKINIGSWKGSGIVEDTVNEPIKFIGSPARIITKYRQQGYITPQQVVGGLAEGAMVPLTIASFGAGGAALNAGKVGGKIALKEAVKRGALQGAKYGVAFGGLRGLGQAQNARTLADQILEGAKQGAIGGVTGGAIGGAIPLAGKGLSTAYKGLSGSKIPSIVSSEKGAIRLLIGKGKDKKIIDYPLSEKDAAWGMADAMRKQGIPYEVKTMPGKYLKDKLGKFIGSEKGFAKIPGFEKQGRNLMEWENSDLTLPELKRKLQIALEGKEDDVAEIIKKDIAQRTGVGIVKSPQQGGRLYDVKGFAEGTGLKGKELQTAWKDFNNFVNNYKGGPKSEAFEAWMAKPKSAAQPPTIKSPTTTVTPKVPKGSDTQLSPNPLTSGIDESQVKTPSLPPQISKNPLSQNQPPQVPSSTSPFDNNIPQTPKPLFEGVRGKLDRIYTETLDRFHPISKLGKLAGKDKEIRNALTGHYGAGSTAKYHVDFELSPILKSSNVDDLRAYVIAQRDIELAGRDIKGSTTDPNKVLAGLRAKGVDMNSLEQKAQQLYQYQDKLVKDYLVKTGIISKENYQAMVSKNQRYVPFKRVMDVVDEQLGVVPSKKGVGSIASQDAIKKIKGSEREIIDPLESVIENTYKIIGLGRRQETAKAIISLRSSLPKGTITPFSGEVGTKPVISLFDKGKVKKYLVPQEVAEAAKGLNADALSTIVKIFAAPTRLFRATATGANPEFAIPNLARDLQSAFVNVGLKPHQWVKGFAHYLKKDQVYQEFLKSGGLTSRISLDRPYLQQTVQNVAGKRGISVVSPKGLYRVLESIGQASEQPTRLAVFEKSLNEGVKKGLTREDALKQAAYAAQEGTVNFARRGASTNTVNMIYAFLNARAQGIDRLARSIKSDPKGASLRIGLITATPALLLYFNNRRFQSFYDERVVSKRDKENNYILMLSDTPIDALGGAQYIKIPKGDVGRLANPLESFLAFADGKDSNILDSSKSFLKGISPIEDIGGIIPTTIRPAVEVAANKNFFFNSPIVPEYKKGYPAKYQDTKSTSPIYRAVGQTINISPAKLESLARGHLTGFARIGENIVNPFVPKKFKTDRNEQGAIVNKAPIVRRFLGGPYRTEEEQAELNKSKYKGIQYEINQIQGGIRKGEIPADEGYKKIQQLRKEQADIYKDKSGENIVGAALASENGSTQSQTPIKFKRSKKLRMPKLRGRRGRKGAAKKIKLSKKSLPKLSFKKIKVPKVTARKLGINLKQPSQTKYNIGSGKFTSPGLS